MSLHVSIFAPIVLLLVCLVPGVSEAAPRTPAVAAYVVFGGQAAEVDVEQGRVVRRLDFIHCLRPAERASISELEDHVIVTGRAAAGGWGRLKIGLSPFRLLEYAPLRREPVSKQVQVEGEAVHQRRPEHLRVIGERRASPPALQPGLYLGLRAADARERQLSVDQHPEDSPDENVDEWTMTPDGKRLLVLTTGGFKHQSYLRIYEYPSLRRRATVPLLEPWDDVPLALFVR